MRTLLALLCLSISCERVDTGQAPPLPPTTQKPAAAAIVTAAPKPAPIVAVVPPPPVSPKPPAPKSHHRAARERVPDEVELPTPPDLAGYSAWFGALSHDEKHQIALFCRANPIEFKMVCGGIGPYHVPRPPSLFPRARGDDNEPGMPPLNVTRQQWYSSMSSSQRSYVSETCAVHTNEGELCEVETPLVVSFDDAPITYTQGAQFAFAGAAHATDWPTATTPWIAVDLDGDGAITSGAELFGSGTALPDGTLAHDGFTALAALDANHDGVIDRADPAFRALVLWADRNGDARSSSDELTPLSSVIDSISLDASGAFRCDARSNCEGARATLHWHDSAGAEHRGTVVDVYLPAR